MPSIKVARLVSTDRPLELGTVEKPIPGPKDVLVKVSACNVVPNTFNLVTGKAEGFNLAMAPLVFGLDVSGEIEAVGEHVQNLKAGDRVYVNPWLTCDTCQACRRNQSDLCNFGALRGYFAISELGMKTLERYPIGGLSEFVTSPDANVCVLPEGFDIDIAARLGYIGTSYGAFKKAGFKPGSTVVINGVTGTLGYAAAAIALGLGAVKILGIGRNPDRLAQVDSFSSNKRLVVASTEEEEDVVKWVKENTNGLGPDVVVDCLGVGGNAETTTSLIKATKRGGKAILLAGSAEGKISQSYTEAMESSITIVGSLWFTNGEMDELISLIDAGVIDLSFLETKSFSLDDVNEAIKFVGDRPGGSVNVVVKP